MPGRFFLGLGAGERLNEQVTGGRWPTGSERRATVEAAVDVIRRLWAGDTVTHADDAFRVERARLFSRPDTMPPIVIAAGGSKTARLAGRIADGMVGVAADPSLVERFEVSGGSGKPRLAQLHVCWAESDDEARRIAHRWWPNAAMPPQILTELATPQQFAAVARGVTEDDVASNVVCGPDPARHVAAIEHFVAAGFTAVYLHQIGPDQHGFFDFYRREVAPRICGP